MKLSPKLAQFLWQFLVEGNLHNYLDILHCPRKISTGRWLSSGAFIAKKLIGFKLASQSTLRQKQSPSQCFRLKFSFFLERRKSPQYDDEVFVFCALLLQKNKAEKCTGKDANGREGGYLTSKPENWTLFLSKVKYRWYPMHRCAHCLLHNA